MNNTNYPKNTENNAVPQQPAQTAPVRQNLANRQPAQPTGAPRPATQNPPPRRPMNNEERRRMEAARQAALRGTTAGASTSAQPPRPANAPTRPAGTPTPRPMSAPVQRPSGTPAPRPTAPRPAPAPQQNVSRPRPVSQTEHIPVTTYTPPQRQFTPDGEYVRDYQNNEPTRNNMTPKKKKRVRIPWGIIVFIIIIAAVVIVAGKHILDNPAEPNNDNPSIIETGDTGDINTPPETGDTNETEAPETDAPAINPYGYAVNKSNTELDVGNLILVNYEHPYARVDSVFLMNVRANKGSDLQVSAMDDALAPDAFHALDKMTAELRGTGCGDWLLLTSGYRDVAEQQGIWDRNLAQSGEEYTKMYVASPGHSEHHTGLAADLSFFTYSYASIPVADHEFRTWLWDNCADYGFILRYEEDKTAITHIAYEAWHFRYVGVPHAYAITALDMCLEEYIDYIKKYSATADMLHIKPDGTIQDINVVNAKDITEGWVTYYVPMAEGDTTEIIIPFSEADFDCEISGNNVDGFIVTVTPKNAN
ncbi:MAG: D-alanyl-D-alanine carboxypeptidase family protein [Clostridia bacterium]|nr:D-alanyl-D-alanine carboxypeptidase family protein [Clostridia bacterium]